MRKLGRGLDSLIPTEQPLSRPDRSLSLAEVKPNPSQPRRHFDPEALKELAASIKVHGIIQPLVVSESPSGGYEVIAGERRLQAAKLANLREVPVIIRTASAQEKLEIGLIENVQRLDLSPVEEARAYKRLVDEFNLTQDEVADKVGKARPSVANTVRLLALPTEILEGLELGKLTEGHARALLGAPPEQQLPLYRRVLEEKLSVREVERLAKYRREAEGGRIHGLERLEAVERALHERLGTKVRVTSRGERGSIRIEYYSREELEHLLEQFGVKLS